MKRPLHMPTPTYPYQFDKLITGLLLLNMQYLGEVINATERYKINEEFHDRKRDKMDGYSAQNNSMLQREYDELQSQFRKIQTVEAELKSQIAFLVAKVYGMFQDISTDTNYEDSLTDFQFKGYLMGYKNVISTSNNDPCYKTSPYDRIIEAINNRFPENIN